MECLFGFGLCGTTIDFSDFTPFGVRTIVIYVR
jgi:hypothetical protein